MYLRRNVSHSECLAKRKEEEIKSEDDDDINDTIIEKEEKDAFEDAGDTFVDAKEAVNGSLANYLENPTSLTPSADLTMNMEF